VTELEHLWSEVEQKRNFIINRIKSLAKRFPTRGHIPENPDCPQPENESAFYELVDVKHDIKQNKQDISNRVSMLNHIINRDKKNKRDWINVSRITNKISTIRNHTHEMKLNKSNADDAKNEHIEMLRDCGNEWREQQRENVRDAQTKVLEKKLDNFYSRKSESMINHQLILEQRRQSENQRLKKSQEIKYQTTLAKIRYPPQKITQI
jgi:hypothetical protein